MNAAVIIAELPRSPRERVRVSLCRHQDRHVIDIRVVTPLASTVDVWAGTKAGLSIDVALIAPLRQALAEAEIRVGEPDLTGGAS